MKMSFTKEEILKQCKEIWKTEYEKVNQINTLDIRKIYESEDMIAVVHEKSDGSLTLKFSIKLSKNKDSWSILIVPSAPNIKHLKEVITLYEAIDFYNSGVREAQ